MVHMTFETWTPFFYCNLSYCSSSLKYAQDQPISLLESESEIDKKFYNLGPRSQLSDFIDVARLTILCTVEAVSDLNLIPLLYGTHDF